MTDVAVLVHDWPELSHLALHPFKPRLAARKHFGALGLGCKLKVDAVLRTHTHRSIPDSFYSRGPKNMPPTPPGILG
jgi:hypothetical protein